MALHPNFPTDPHAILDPAIGCFPADEALDEGGHVVGGVPARRVDPNAIEAFATIHVLGQMKGMARRAMKK